MLKKAKAEAEAEAKGRAGASDSTSDFAQVIRDSSRQIWLAGLGAFSRAQAEGMKMFETLVEQGQNLESRTKRRASETATAAAGMATQKAKEMQAMAGGTWDKLEQVFEDRVARALSKLGVHTQADVDRLAQRVEALSEAVNELIKSGGGRAGSPASTAAKRAAKRSARTRKTSAQPAAAPVQRSASRQAAAQPPAAEAESPAQRSAARKRAKRRSHA